MRMIVLYEKYSVYRFAVKDDAEIYRACEKIVSERLKSGYYYPKQASVEPDKPDELPHGSPAYAHVAYQNRLNYYESELESYEEEKETWDSLNDAIYEGGIYALNFLESRSDHEYEGFEIVDFDDIESYGV